MSYAQLYSMTSTELVEALEFARFCNDKVLIAKIIRVIEHPIK